jgi:hypothetical protein
MTFGGLKHNINHASFVESGSAVQLILPFTTHTHTRTERFWSAGVCTVFVQHVRELLLSTQKGDIDSSNLKGVQ